MRFWRHLTWLLCVLTPTAWAQPSSRQSADVRATVRAALSIRPPIATDLASLPTLVADRGESAHGLSAVKNKAAENASAAARGNGRGVALGVAKRAAAGETRIPPGQAKKLGIPKEKPTKSHGKP